MIGHAVPDIPRYYTALAEWLSCGLFVILLGPKLSKPKLAIVGVIYLAALTMFMELTATITLWLWIPCMVAAFLSMAVFIWFANKISFYESVFYAVMAFSIAECIASLEWQIVNSIYTDINQMPWYIEILALTIVYGIVLFSLWKLLRTRINKERRLSIEKRDWFISLFICVIVFGFSNLSFITVSSSVSGQYFKEIAYTRTLVDIAGVAMLYAHFLTCRNNMVNRELDAVQNALKNQYVQYKQSRESIDIINMKYHDLKHQINMLRNLNDNEQRSAFLDSMEADIRAYELQNKTGNSVLDTLIIGKSMYCSKHGITMTVVADGKLLDFMDSMDICSIFGNALDNAIESVMKTNEKEKRLIHLSVSQVKSFVMIRIENYYEGNLKIDDGNFITTKNDKRFHGYGIKSIKYTVDRYDGVVNINAENHWFELKILIPYNN